MEFANAIRLVTAVAFCLPARTMFVYVWGGVWLTGRYKVLATSKMIQGAQQYLLAFWLTPLTQDATSVGAFTVNLHQKHDCIRSVPTECMQSECGSKLQQPFQVLLQTKRTTASCSAFTRLDMTSLSTTCVKGMHVELIK